MVLALLIPSVACGQQDSLFLLSQDTELPTEDKRLDPGRPTKIALLAASFPGMGQIANRRYWKVPIVYGGFVAFASLIDFNHAQYTRFRDALIFTADGDQLTIPRDEYLQNRTPDQLRRGRDFYRRNRDYNIILTIGWYGLTIADAVVDSHLMRFDIDNNLSARIRPAVLPVGGAQQALAPGIGVVFALGPMPASSKPNRF